MTMGVYTEWILSGIAAWIPRQQTVIYHCMIPRRLTGCGATRCRLSTISPMELEVDIELWLR
jgi:hypothetical protein